MKHENALRLAKEASANVWDGGASAMVKAKRIASITGNWDAEEIVSRVYSHPRGTASYECRECGQEHLTHEEAGTCCSEEAE